MTGAIPGTERPIKLAIAALGGQGGGVLTDWLIHIAEAENFLVQSTSVPGVAQRTGATIYYLEFFSRAAAEKAGRDPVMALMPVPADVDCVLASELVEAGRVIQRGLVTPNRTTLIASSHRSYAIVEKSAMGDGATDSAAIVELLRASAKRLVLFDMDAVAEQHRSVISSVLLGALAGASVLPFRKGTYEAAIRETGIAIETNLAAFEEAYRKAQTAEADGAGTKAVRRLREVPAKAQSPGLQSLLDRVRKFPVKVQPTVLEGVRRAIDYQDLAYASLYLDRLERITAAAAQGSEPALMEEVARSLALWMTFEDTIRVADLKTRAARFERVRSEVQAKSNQVVGIVEFMKPRVEEMAGTMPAGLGRWLLRSPRVRSVLGRWTGGRQIRTTTISGFLLLYVLAGFKRWRRGTLRYTEENGRIEAWLSRIEGLAARNPALAAELARAQKLVKGYGETHERGLRNFAALVERIEELDRQQDGAAVFRRLQAAALADEEGASLARELAKLDAAKPAQSALALNG